MPATGEVGPIGGPRISLPVGEAILAFRRVYLVSATGDVFMTDGVDRFCIGASMEAQATIGQDVAIALDAYPFQAEVGVGGVTRGKLANPSANGTMILTITANLVVDSIALESGIQTQVCSFLPIKAVAPATPSTINAG